MVLKKILSKKKGSPKYFLEVEVTDPAPETPVMETTEETSTEAKKQAKSAPTVKTSPAVANDQPEWVKAIKNYSNAGSSENTSESSESATYADKYITNDVPQSRRRPGASLKMFKNIASQINK